RLHFNYLTFTSIKSQPIKDELKALTKKHEKISPMGRLDLCDKEIFSIDPPGCRDVDDALHIEKKDKTSVIGIHIADVSEWVTPDSAIDLYARQRMTSVYLPKKTHHMLPPELSENYCSLIKNQKRYTLSLLL